MFAQAAALVIEVCVHRHTPSRVAARRIFQDQACAVYHLSIPSFFEHPLLHWRQRGIDTNEIDTMILYQFVQTLDRAFTEIGAGIDLGECNRLGHCFVQIYRRCQANSFFQSFSPSGRGRYRISGMGVVRPCVFEVVPVTPLSLSNRFRPLR